MPWTMKPMPKVVGIIRHMSGSPVGGRYAWRREGERHRWDPDTIAALRGLK